MLSFHGAMSAGRSVAVALITGLVLGSCGGGGGGGPSDLGGAGAAPPAASAEKTLAGTAATGAPIAFGTVTLKDSAGSVVSATTDASGKFSFDAGSLSFPVMLLVQPNVPGAVPLFSAALTAGTANITPLTTLQVFEASGRTDPSALFGAGNFAVFTTETLDYGRTVVASNLESLLVANGVAGGADPVTTPFNADGQGMDAVVHNVNVVTAGSTPVLTNPAGACIPYGFNSKGTTFALDGLMPTIAVSALLDDWNAGMFFPSPAGYVAESLRSVCMPGDIRRIDWSRLADLGSTRAAVLELKNQLQNAVRDGKQPINVVAHDWGTVIAYIALDELRADPSVKVANLVTMGSLLWMLEPASPGQKPLAPAAAQAIRALVPEAYRGQLLRSLPNVGKWSNFNSGADVLSGPLAAAVNVSVSCPSGATWVKGSDGADRPCNPHSSYFQQFSALASGGGSPLTALPISLREVHSLLAGVSPETAPVRAASPGNVGATPGATAFPPGASTASIVDPSCVNATPSSSPKELRWTASEGAINYRVFRNGIGLGGNLAQSQRVFQGLVPPAAGQRDTYAVLAINANGATLGSAADLTSAGAACAGAAPAIPAPSCTPPQVALNGSCVAPPSTEFSISTALLVPGTLGSPYTSANPLAASGGQAPYAWSASGLPPGISLAPSGALSGTPAAAGTFSVTITVADSSSPRKSISKTLVLVVGEAAAVLPDPAPSPPLVNVVAPQLASPFAGQTIDTPTPTLSWAGGLAPFWKVNLLDIATNATFTSAALPGAQRSYAVAGGVLQPGASYRWQVTACPDATCDNLVTYRPSVSSVFTVALPAFAAVAPTLSLPSSNATGVSLAPTLEWTGGSANFWRVSIRNLSTNAVHTSTLLAPAFGIYSVPGIVVGQGGLVTSTLQGGVQYRWEVTACPDAACDNPATYRTSASAVFTTRPAAVAPTVAVPAYNSVNIPLAPTLQWNGSSAVAWRIFMFDPNGQPVFVTGALPPSPNTYIVPAGLLRPNARYVWTVGACLTESCTEEETSALFVFTTGP